MTSLTFQGTVSNGQLHHTTPLTAFEGHHVFVTVIAPKSSEAHAQDAVFDAEPPPDLDVEKEVFVTMPRPARTLTGVQVVSRGPRKPNLVLPEELPDA